MKHNQQIQQQYNQSQFDGEEQNHNDDGSYADMQHQMTGEMNNTGDGNHQDDEPSKMFTFDDHHNEERQSQRSAGVNQSMQKNQFQGNPSRTQQ